ncbi:MAG: acyltransferase [Planctomycetota bacterium]
MVGDADASTGRVAQLDGLRGLAVFLVLASHASNAGIDLAPGLRAGGLGRPGVFLFFVLSSFLLSGPLFARERAGLGIHWGRFALRRILRVMPAYVFALGCHVAVGVMEPRPALEHVALVRAEHHFWTIPVEILFYAALPIVVFALRCVQGTRSQLMALGLMVVGASFAFEPDFRSGPPRYAPTVLPFLPIFLVGSMLALFAALPTGVRSQRAAPWLGGAALAALVLTTPSVWALLSGAAVPHTRFHLWFVPFALLWAAVLFAALQRGSWMGAAASWGPLRGLGQISYSVYLFHGLMLGLVVERGAGLGVAPWLRGPLFLGLACLAGAASYMLVERPFLGLLSQTSTETSSTGAKSQ